ncbi:MAG: diphosphate--fructose-6-phosphate 1-phosphotransferase [candidate division WOR-3 bacterium]
MGKEISILERYRKDYKPKLPRVFAENGAALEVVEGERLEPEVDKEAISKLFPHTYGLPVITFKKGAPQRRPLNVGVILSGGQAPGGHNVIAGLFDSIKSFHPQSRLFGFLGGPIGVIKGVYKELTAEIVDEYRNTGGFDIIGSGRDKIEKEDQIEAAFTNCKKLGIEGLVIIGGDDSNTNACLMAEYYLSKGMDLKIIGVPKTIDGDLKNKYIETSFGFDTATKLYSELIGNVARDANSAKKYYHFIKVMGRSASHIALECALQTHPNICLIGEEAAAKGYSLSDIVEYIVNIVVKRAEAGKNFGIVIIPEGIIEFLPDIKNLIKELNEILAQNVSQFNELQSESEKIEFVLNKISQQAATTFKVLPTSIQAQLLLDRDPHGNVQLSRIESEKLLADLVEKRLNELKAQGKYKGKFSSICHFFGYEGRCAPPSNFDADYCYSLGYCAAALLAAGKTGYIANIRGLNKPASEWIAGGVPLTAMLNIERRKGKDVPVIKKALVDLQGKPFAEFVAHREIWAIEEAYLYPGPIQYFGPSEICDRPTRTLELELA